MAEQGYGPAHHTRIGYGVHHVRLAIPPGAEPRSRDFYVRVLGMVEITRPPEVAARGGLWLRADDLEIHLGVEADFHPSPGAHPGIRVLDLDALASRLQTRGASLTWDDDFPGHRRLSTTDPQGNRLEFLQRS